jgi:hypothetical protein
MNAIPTTSMVPDLASTRASEISTKSTNSCRRFTNNPKDKQSWLKDPREIHASEKLHQLPFVNETGIAWDHTNHRYHWHREGTPVARPLTHGGLKFSEESQWWERNGSLWKPEKKLEVGHQTAVDLRHLGVVVQPRVSRFVGRAKTILRLDKPPQESIGAPKENPRGVPTIVCEVSDSEAVAQRTFDLTARSDVLYARKQPFRLLKALSHKACRHPSTCPLHPHLNVDIPQTIAIPFVEEPEKLRWSQSAFMLRPCGHKGHEHLSHEQDPCFSNATGDGIDLQNREDVIRHVNDLAATGTRAERLERIWQREEERERQEEILMSMPSQLRKENRPPSVSAQTLFYNAARSLQQQSASADLPSRQDQSFYPDMGSSFHLRGGAGARQYTGQLRSWRMREWFTNIRREPVRVIHNEAEEDNDRRGSRGRQVRHRVMRAHEAGMTEDEWANLPVLSASDIEDILGRHEQGGAGNERISAYRRGPNEIYHDQCGRPVEAEYVNTISNETRRRIEQLSNSSRRPQIPSRSHSYAPSGSSGSIEVIRDVNVQRQRPGPPDDAYGREHYGPYGDEPASARIRREWAQWDGRTPLDANVLTRSPGRHESSRPDPSMIDREPGLRGGSAGHRGRWGGRLTRVRAWARGLFARCRLPRERTAVSPGRLPVTSSLTPIILLV